MRLFIAINFDDAAVAEMLAVQDRLRAYGSGNFTREENLHLTLAFLGEVDAADLDEVKACMDEITMRRLRLDFSRVGCFRRDSELWWIGAEENKVLSGIQRRLVNALKDAGLPVDDKRFKPHITLAREMNVGKLSTEDLLPEPFSTEVDAISLMLSERINGKLTYTEIYRVGKE